MERPTQPLTKAEITARQDELADWFEHNGPDPAALDAYVLAVGHADILRNELQLPDHIPVQINIGRDMCTGMAPGIPIQINIGPELAGEGPSD